MSGGLNVYPSRFPVSVSEKAEKVLGQAGIEPETSTTNPNPNLCKSGL